MVTTPTAARPATNWRLRGTLLAALAALVATALGVSASGSASHEIAPHRAPRRRHPPATTKTPTTTTVPGATTATVTRPVVGGPCGFALAPPMAPGQGAAAARPVGHCTVLEIGDSLGNDLGWGISRHVSTTSGLDLIQKDVSSTGLADLSYYNWAARLATDLRQYHPNLVLISLGGNDQQGIYVDGNAAQFPSPTWQRGYLARVEQLVGEASDAGAYVAWVGLPIMQQSSYSEGTQLLDGLYKKGVTATPNGTYISTWSLFSNPAGQFQSNASVNGTPTTLREPDGIHYSYSGEDVIATYVLRELAAIYHVALAPTEPAVVTSWG